MTDKSFAKIVSTVATLCRCQTSDILADKRAKPVQRAKQIVAIVLRDRGLSYPEIGQWMNEAHNTALYQVRRFEQEVAHAPTP